MLKPAQLSAAAHHHLWDVDLSTMPAWRRRLLRALRVGYAVIRDVSEGQLTLRAMSLVYTTLLSLVPLLAVSFSVLKAFGVHNQVEPLLLNLLAPLGDKGLEITERIIEFVENIKAGLLGSVGLAFLVYTVISLLQKVERAFNFTWHVTAHRPFTQRFSDYLSVILIGPVLVFSALGLTATIASSTLFQQLSAIEPLGSVIEGAGRLLPYLLIIGAFTFVYIFVPNTKVRVGSALVGALIAGVLWESAGWLFASFVVSSVKYTAIYSAFATLIVFMIWLYLSWLILLIGASIAFYHQHPEYVRLERHQNRLSNRAREKLALSLMALIGRRYYDSSPQLSAQRMAQQLGIPSEVVEEMVESLADAGLLAPTLEDDTTYLPRRPLETVSLSELLEIVRRSGSSPRLDRHIGPPDEAAEQVIERLERNQRDALAGWTLKDLALSATELEKSTGPPPERARSA